MMAEEEVSTSFDWIKSLSPRLAGHDRVPLLPGPVDFSWKALADRLRGQLQIKELYIDKGVPVFETKEEVTAHFKEPHITLPILFSPQPEPLYVLLSRRELVHLLCHLLGQHDASDTLEEPYLMGFVSFLAAAIFDTIEALVPKEGWSLRLGEAGEIPKGDYLSFSVAAHFDQALTLYPRLAIPVSWYASFQERYALMGRQEGSKVGQKVDMTVAMQVGSAFLSYEEWAKVEAGDFVLLDRLTLMPGQSKGKVLMTLNSKPLFRAKVKKGALKIDERVTHYEVSSAMEKDEEETAEDIQEEGLEPDQEEVGEFAEGYEEKEAEPAPAAQAPTVEAPPVEIKESGHPPVVPFTQESLDVELLVEIGRLKITLDKLMQLEPGNILKLDVNPESGVDLVVNGKVVGRGELLKIGDLLGVRVLDLGK